MLFRLDSPTAREKMNMLNDEFGEQFISRKGDVNWPTRSCNQTIRMDHLKQSHGQHLHEVIFKI